MTENGLINDKKLPDREFDMLWDRIILEDEKKKRLLNQVILELTVRPKFSSGEIPLHGVILLVGPPGTGKTSLAKAVASKAASLIKNRSMRYVEVDPHSITSSALGKSQRAVRDLLHESIAGMASSGPLIVLLDEVETLAADRSKLSLEANPIDVHRATDAVLSGLDALAAKYPNLLFIATSNFKNAVDEALVSRADLVLEIPLPSEKARFEILSDSVGIMAAKWPSLNVVRKDTAGLKNLVRKTEGFDARKIRKTVFSACAMDSAIALDPGKLTMNDLDRAFSTQNEAVL